MKCPHCGMEIPTGSTFCPYCGKKISQPMGSVFPPSEGKEPPSQGYPTGKPQQSFQSYVPQAPSSVTSSPQVEPDSKLPLIIITSVLGILFSCLCPIGTLAAIIVLLLLIFGTFGAIRENERTISIIGVVVLTGIFLLSCCLATFLFMGQRGGYYY